MTIHIVMGPPCSGKSSFVQLNAPAGTPRFDFDLVASAVAGTDTKHTTPPAVMDTVLAMRRGLMGWVLDVEATTPDIWIIHSNPSPTLLTRLAGAQAEFHLLDPGVEECIARAIRDGRPPETEAAIRAWYASPPEIPGEKGARSVRTKSIDVKLKAADVVDQGEGIMTAYASVFDVVDSYGDVVRKGAFADSLAEWKASGNVMPLLYGHDFRDPFRNIGGVTDAVEDDRGLKITAQFDLDTAVGAQVYRLVKEKRLSQMSFAYDILDASWAEQDGDEVFELKKLKLYEVSVVPIGANQETEILELKNLTTELRPWQKTALDHLVPGVIEQLRKQGYLHPPEDETTTSDPTQGLKNALTARFNLLERNPHA